MRSILVALLVVAAGVSASAQVGAEWIDSPEAYFATQLERIEWMRLTNDAERAGFVERYWQKRDPTAGTPKNEFREQIESRIRVADEKFAFKKTRGAATQRGFVWVVFGPPARFRATTAPPPERPRPPVLGETREPVGTTEIGESYETWTYDRQRTPNILEMVGLPTLQFDFVIKPHKQVDELQSPGLAKELRAKLADRSVAQADAGLPAAVPVATSRLDATIDATAARALDDAPPPTLGTASGYFASSARWSDRGDPVVTVWFAPTSRLSTGGTFTGRIRRADGSVAGTLSEPLRAAPSLRSSGGADVYAVQFPLSPGDYTGAFAVIGEAGQTIASASLPIRVADASKFAASSIVLSATPGPAGATGFSVGPLGVVPRADQTFSRSESLWYAGEVANPSDPKSVVIDVRLRSGASVLGASQIALESEPSTSGRYFFARELPLSGFQPGDYSLYFVIRDASGAQEIRRADFRIVP